MRATIIRSLEKRIQSYADFIKTVDSADLDRTLDVPKTKSVAEHLWCIIGARESYARALAAGAWQGFACSLTTFDAETFEHALDSSGQTLLKAIRGVPAWSAQDDEWLLTVAEHEVMHEGQIIRHMYAIGRDLPDSWRWA